MGADLTCANGNFGKVCLAHSMNVMDIFVGDKNTCLEKEIREWELGLELATCHAPSLCFCCGLGRCHNMDRRLAGLSERKPV